MHIAVPSFPHPGKRREPPVDVDGKVLEWAQEMHVEPVRKVVKTRDNDSVNGSSVTAHPTRNELAEQVVIESRIAVIDKKKDGASGIRELGP